jgi:hypothetical protein
MLSCLAILLVSLSLLLLAEGVQDHDLKNKISINYMWRNMTTEEINGWYNTNDLCFLNNRRGDKKKCQRNRPVMGMYCGLGMGGCPYPVTNREYFYRVLEGFENPFEKPLTSFVKYLSQRNQTMVFVGDSLMLQTFQAFVCQLDREGLIIEANHTDDRCHFSLNVFTKDHFSFAKIEFLRIGSLDSIQTCPTNRAKSGNGTGTWPYTVHYINQLVNVSPFISY